MLPTSRDGRILVTGGCGFIGGHLLSALVERNYNVTVLDDLSTGSEKNLPKHPGVTFVRGNAMDPEAVAEAAKDVTFVFHLASVVGMKLVTEEPQRTYDVSVKGTETVLNGTGNVPFLLFSSSAVYGLSTPTPSSEEVFVTEEAALSYDGGRPGYALGKRQAEVVAVKALEAGRPVQIIRPFNTVGPGQPVESGMVIPRLVSQAMSGEPMTVFGDGNQSRCFSLVTTVVECVLRVAATPAIWADKRTAVNIGAQNPTTILELCQIIREECNSNSELVHVPYEQVFPGKHDVRFRVPNLSQLEQQVGHIDWPDIRTIVKRYIATMKPVPA